MWKVEFYVKPNGRCPAQEFLDNLSRDELPFVDRGFGWLAEFGYRIKRPHAAFLRDGIYELRVRTHHGQLRFLYFYFESSIIVVTHGFRKKTAKVPEAEIERAIDCREDYLNRYKGTPK